MFVSELKVQLTSRALSTPWIGAVGYQDGQRFVIATAADGTVVLGQPDDFDVRVRLPRKRCE